MKPQHTVLLVAAVIFGVALFYMSVTNGDVGTVSRTADGITHVYSNVEGNETLVLPIRLQEGGDVEHESAHVFDVLNGRIGVENATLALDGSSVSVKYSSREASPDSIRDAFVQSGYATEQ